MAGELSVSDELVSNGMMKLRFVLGVVARLVFSFVTGVGTSSATGSIVSSNTFSGVSFITAFRSNQLRFIPGRSSNGRGKDLPKVFARSPGTAWGVDLKFDTGLIAP